MDMLLNGNRIVVIGDEITFGLFDEPFEKWRIREGKYTGYYIDSNFTLVKGVTVPDDYEEGKYFYENGEFVLNEDWAPYVTPEERITQLEAQVAIHEENDAELLYQVCLLQLGLSEEDL